MADFSFTIQGYKSLRGNISDTKGSLQMLLPLGQNEIRLCAMLFTPNYYFC